MADVYEQNLAQKTSLTTSDYIRVVGSNNVSYKQSMDSVMGTIGLKYTDLGAFSTQSALETALNTKLDAIPTNSTASIRFSTSAGFGAFQNGVTYICDLRKGGSATYASISLHGLGINTEIVGNKSSSTWTFQKDPLQRYVSNITTGNSCSFYLNNHETTRYHYGLLIGGGSGAPYLAHIFISASDQPVVTVTPVLSGIITVTGTVNPTAGTITFTVTSGNANGGLRFIDLS